jgi:hypothetical protein
MRHDPAGWLYYGAGWLDRYLEYALVAVDPREPERPVAEWSEWTGMNFDRSGDIVVPGALVPVHVSSEQDHAVYVEPNLWVHHRV